MNSQHQESELLEAVELMWENGSGRYQEAKKVLFLKGNIELERAVRNDKTASDSNRTVAFVQGPPLRVAIDTTGKSDVHH